MSEQDLPQSFFGALQALTRWLETARVPYVTIGGVAVSLLAQPRATQDIVIVIWLAAEQWADFVCAGAEYGFAPRISDAVAFASQARVLLLRHQPSGISVDVSCGALSFEQEMIERAQTLQIGDLKLQVPTAEDLVVTKFVAQRMKDIADIEAILNVRQNLDLDYVRRWAREFAVALEMPELLESLESLFERAG
jgi:hypothetical protein